MTLWPSVACTSQGAGSIRVIIIINILINCHLTTATNNGRESKDSCDSVPIVDPGTNMGDLKVRICPYNTWTEFHFQGHVLLYVHHIDYIPLLVSCAMLTTICPSL